MMASGVSQADPFTITEGSTIGGGVGWRDPAGKTLRTTVINPALKTLVLISAGQSQWTTIQTGNYSPTNGSALDNLSIYDGANYAAADPMLGQQWTTGGVSSLHLRIADLLITNGKFDRVINVPLGVGSTTMDDWTNGQLGGRIAVAVKRLAARGITPATTGVTFALIWGQGESDGFNGVAQATWQAGFGTVKSRAIAAGFSGRFFVVKETWLSGTTYSTIQAAQTAVVDGVTVFAGGNMDSLDATNRQAGNTHLNDTGAAAYTTLLYNAMHASGAPY